MTIDITFMFRSFMYEFKCYVFGECWFLQCVLREKKGIEGRDRVEGE